MQFIVVIRTAEEVVTVRSSIVETLFIKDLFKNLDLGFSLD
jgi:hypothetical protein